MDKTTTYNFTCCALNQLKLIYFNNSYVNSPLYRIFHLCKKIPIYEEMYILEIILNTIKCNKKNWQKECTIKYKFKFRSCNFKNCLCVWWPIVWSRWRLGKARVSYIMWNLVVLFECLLMYLSIYVKFRYAGNYRAIDANIELILSERRVIVIVLYTTLLKNYPTFSPKT